LIEVASTSPTEQQVLPSTSILTTPGISTIGILAISVVFSFTTSLSLLFGKLYYTLVVTKETKDKLLNIDEDLKASTQ
jgi:hypothetical protein